MIEYENLRNLNAPFLDEINLSVKKTIESGWFILGNEVRTFEENFAKYVGTKYCIGVASGLDALILSLAAYEFPKESEIIVPSNTYIATILAIIQAGLKPVLVEPDINTYNIDPKLINEKITVKTKAILVVHMYGKCCEMDKVQQIAKDNNLKIIEDCAQSHGSKFNNVKAGSIGNIGAFSFYPTKNLGAFGDAGAITTNDDDIADKLLYLRNYGSKIKYHNKYIGYNSRLDEVQASILNIKLKYLNKINDHKRKLANIYFEDIQNDEITLPLLDTNYYDTYHIFAIRIEKRDQLKNFLFENGIKSEIHYPIAPHRQEGYQDYFANQNYPISEKIHQTELSLPISFAHTEEEIIKVVNKINSF